MTHAAADSLLYAVRPAVIAKRAGQLAVLLAAVIAVPLLVSLVAGEPVAALRYAVVVAALTAVGFGLARVPAPVSIQANEALALCAMAFTLTPLALTWPVMAAGIGFTDALFECVSAITTTGLSTLGSVEGRALSFLFERSWMQWIGGLGIVVLSVALLAGDDLAARRLVDSPISQETLDTSTRLHARRSVATYAVLTLGAVALLVLAGWSGRDAVLLALAAISTGGFAPYDASLAAAPQWPARLAVIGVAFLGAVSLPLYHALWRRRWKVLAEAAELRALIVMCAIVSVGLALLMAREQGSWSTEIVTQALATAVSAQTTSGFATMPLTSLGPAALLVLIVAMTIGGSVGSTAGGVKLLRVLLLLRVVQHMLRRTAMPDHAVATPQLQGRPVGSEAIANALLLVLLFAVTVLLSWLPFLVLGHAPMASLFEVVSAVGTVGLSARVTGPELHPLLKGVLCVDMVMGRLEFIAVLVVLVPRTWFGRRRSA
jgi:trk system potassium uptake protein TrkH